jgi:hypothetical protein
MNLTDADVTSLRLSTTLDLERLAEKFLLASSGPDADRAMQNMEHVCMTLSPDCKRTVLNRMIMKVHDGYRYDEMQFEQIQRINWFLSDVTGRASQYVLEMIFVVPRSIKAKCALTRILVPGLACRYLTHWMSEEEEALTETDSFGDARDLTFAQHRKHDKNIYVFELPWRTEWDDAVKRGCIAYSAQLVSVLLTTTPLANVLVLLVADYIV